MISFLIHPSKNEREREQERIKAYRSEFLSMQRKNKRHYINLELILCETIHSYDCFFFYLIFNQYLIVWRKWRHQRSTKTLLKRQMGQICMK